MPMNRFTITLTDREVVDLLTAMGFPGSVEDCIHRAITRCVADCLTKGGTYALAPKE